MGKDGKNFMRILVTGGAGFIGSFTVDKLIKLGHAVRILDNLDSQVHSGGRLPKYINKGAEFKKGDVRNRDVLCKAVKDAEIIFHFAACVGVSQSQYLIKKYTDVTVGGTSNLLDIIVNTKNKVKKIIVAASMSSYGEGLYECDKCGNIRPGLRQEAQLAKRQWESKCPKCNKTLKAAAINEEQQMQCNSIYAITKRVQEDMVLNIGRAYKIPAVALRFFNVYGPRQALSNPYTGVCAIFISRIKNNHAPVIYEDGIQTRDFVSVHEVVDANILAMGKKEADYQSFNVGSGKPVSIKEIAETLIKLYNKQLKPQIANKYRKGDIRHCFADISKIKKTLGFKPRVEFVTGMRELVEWSRTQQARDGFERAKSELKKKGLL
jgi:dTDP-L-rhamnose 4-epimerase